MSATAGFDIAKEFHWLTVIDDHARLLAGHRVDNDSAAIIRALRELHAVEAEHGPVTVGLDVVGGISGLLTALARRRVNVLYAILRDRQPYQARPPLHLVT
ncbi:IS110 family transposase [Streptomyces prunicolor]|uniref:IS110 family transposase n=1 Tax=Streptomyces prunicolor TaxID=67348 RepID=UPI00224E7C20|nr:transposase [Streptomyces prunicolor]MCX5235484.1 IS110 family transposase [Streptomyces prunicolor]